MKKVFQSTVIFLAVMAITAVKTTAQTAAQNKAYWENEAKKALGQADRFIDGMNQKTNTFSPQELQMMRSNDPRVRQQFIELNRAKQQRMAAAQQQYEAHYNQQWAQSFNTFNTSKPAPAPSHTYTAPVPQPTYSPAPQRAYAPAPQQAYAPAPQQTRQPRYYVRNAAGQYFPVY